LVFALYKVEAERLERFLQQRFDLLAQITSTKEKKIFDIIAHEIRYLLNYFRGWKAVSIHGNKAQSERTRSLSLFKEGSCPLLVCVLLSFRNSMANKNTLTGSETEH